MEKKFRIEHFFLVAQTIILLLTLVVAYIELENIKAINSASLALELYRDIRSDQVFKANPKIVSAIYNGGKILKENGGNIDETDLDNYLNELDWIAAANNIGILTDDMVYNFHGDLILSTIENAEINGYLKETRKQDNKYYNGFIDLAEKMKVVDKKVAQ